jgi:putative oxidoreductase
MQAIMSLGCKVYGYLDKLGEWLPMLGLRAFIAYEFWEAGIGKYNGENWFESSMFPLPFSLLPSNLNWLLVTWTELAGSIAILVGFATRFSAASLIILDIVAWYSVHAENGYNVCSNGFQLPLMYLLMLLPLLLIGPGKASLDNLFFSKCHQGD